MPSPKSAKLAKLKLIEKEVKTLPLEERLVNKSDIIRFEANRDLAALCNSISDPKDPRILHIGRVFRKTLLESDVHLLDKILDALIAYLKIVHADVAKRYGKEVCYAIVSNCFTRWPHIVEKAEKVLMLWLRLDCADFFLAAMEKAIEHKAAKAVVTAIDIMIRSLSKFGPATVPRERILMMLPGLCEHKDKDVFDSTKRLSLELCRRIGKNRVKSFLFEEKKGSMMKEELEAELANLTEPTRKIRFEQNKEPEKEDLAEPEKVDEAKAAGFGPSEGAATTAETSPEFDQYESFDPVDILPPLEKSGFWKAVRSSKWYKRKDAVADLTTLASTKRIAPANFLPIMRILKELITDAKIAVRVEAVNAIRSLAVGLRSHFSECALYILPTLLEKLEDNTPRMMYALCDTLKAVHTAGCVTLFDIVKDTKAALKSNAPLARSLTLKWVTDCIETSQRDVVIHVHKEYIGICMECLNHWTPSAISVLAAFAKILGMKFLKQSFAKLDDVQKKLIEDLSVSSSGGVLSGKEKKDTPYILQSESRPCILPGFLYKDLYSYQVKGIRWLWALHLKRRGGLLADDMGLGKTRQMAAFVAGLYESGLTEKVLLVCPKTLLPQWYKEFLLMGLPKCNMYHGDNKLEEFDRFKLKRKGILITSYSMVTADYALLMSTTYDYTIIDEGHKIKNSDSDISVNIRRIPSAHRIILTGTPIQNKYEELWALFNYCNPEVFGSIERFKKDIKSPLAKGTERFAGVKEMDLCLDTKKQLDDSLKPFLLRRTKDEVLTKGEIPNKTEFVVWLRLTDVQREIYTSISQSDVFVAARKSLALAALTILRKVCAHPVLTQRSELLEKTKTNDKMGGTSGGSDDPPQLTAKHLSTTISQIAERYAGNLTSCKISFIKTLVVDLVREKHHILVFSEWQQMLDLIEESLPKYIKCLRLDGGCTDAKRKSNIEDFQSGKADVFLLTTGVGGVGITLTTADRVILADPSWNPSTDNQSVDRAYRIGQKNNVVVYRVLTSGTMEEKVFKTQVNKSVIINSVMDTRLQCSFFAKKEKSECFNVTDFELSSELKELIKKQDVMTRDPVFQQLNAMPNIAGILNHSDIFKKRDKTAS